MTTENADDSSRRRWRAYGLLREALDVDEAERAPWIARRCAGDAALAAELHALLATQAPSLLDGEAGALAARLVAAGAPEDELACGSRLGTWRIQRTLGHGGMGTVYLVERAGDGYTQRDALKLIKRGMDSAAVLARFRRERQILSQLEHPNIARLLDGGVSDEGQPWFVMEYIDGLGLRQWLAQSSASLAARIAAWLQLCDAVAHAHRHLIVHRDIKPENVLITGEGHARLLDFGIARLLADEADEHTRTQQRFVSRAYAAPEQLRGDATTTATDIYQLGALLFELLTGTRFDGARGSGAISGWLVRARAGADAATRRAIPAARVRGDAAIIVARATDADPTRRYATVTALAADVQAWRDGRPIAARADSASYRLRRFVARHRAASAVAVLALLAVLTATALALWQARRAASEAALARAAQAFLTSVFDASSPDTAAGARVTARELLDRGRERIDTQLADQPELRGEMQVTLGTLYAQLGQYTEAETLLGAAHGTLATTDPVAAARAALERVAVLRELGRIEEAEHELDAMLPQTSATPALHSRALVERAQLREKQGRFDEALADTRAALQLDLAQGSSTRAEQARDRQFEALVLTRLARFDEATTTFERALTDARSLYGNADTRVALMLNDYGAALAQGGHSKEAEAALRQALEIRRQRLGADHPAVAETQQVLGATLRPQGRYEEARAALEDALRIQRTNFGSVHPMTANTLNSLGMLAFARRRPADGEAAFREAIEIYRKLGQSDTPAAATMSNNLATVLIQQGRYDEAEPLIQHALALHRKAVGERHPIVMSDLNSLSQLEMRRGHSTRSLDYGRRAVDIALSPASPPREGAYVRVSWAIALNHAGQAQQALQEVDAAIATLKGIAADEPRLPVAQATRAEALLRLGRLDEAHALATTVLAEREQHAPDDATMRARLHALLAHIADARGQGATARREREAARRLVATMTPPDPFLMAEIEQPLSRPTPGN